MVKQDLEEFSLLLNKEIKKFEFEKSRQQKLQKSQGTIYTPQKIADFIVKDALKLLFSEYFGSNLYNDFSDILLSISENQKIKNEIMNLIPTLKFLDPACGTGRFLISIAKKLFLIYKRLYPNVLDYDIKKTVIEKNLFGIDIDISAIKISKLRLIKWLLSGVQNVNKLKLKVENIDFILKKYRLNFNFYKNDFLLDFNLKNFDIILGNPPYIENKKISDKTYKKKLRERFNSAYKLYDLSILFIEKALEILKENKGILSFLTTNKFLAADYGLKIREFLTKKAEIKQIIDLSSLSIFHNIAAYPIIITLKKQTPVNGLIKIKRIKNLELLNQENLSVMNEIPQNSVNLLPCNVIPISKNLKLVKFLYKNYKQMSKEIPDLKIVYRPYGFINWSKNFKYVSQTSSSNSDLLLIGTGNVGKYHIDFEKPIRIAQHKLNICYFNYHNKFESKWNQLSGEKLISREIAKDLTFSYDPGIFTNITGLYFIIIPSYNTNQMFSLLLLLNSELINLVFKALFGTLHMAGDYLRINGSFIKRLPLLNVLPTSISSLGKSLQFLSQLKSDFIKLDQDRSFKSIDISSLEELIIFYKKLSDAIINALYLQKTNSLDYKNLFDSINHLPNIDTKYFTRIYNISNYSIYGKNERESIFNSLLNIYADLNGNKQTLKQIERFQKLIK